MIENEKHILISLLGRTPQILTETLYALMIGQKIPISDIWVLTTYEGFQAITDHLIHPRSGKFYTFCQDWQIDPSKIKFNPEQYFIALNQLHIRSLILNIFVKEALYGK